MKVYFWKYDKYVSYLGLATDTIMFASKHDAPYTRLLSTLKNYFFYTTVAVTTLPSLIYYIIHNKYDTSMD